MEEAYFEPDYTDGPGIYSESRLRGCWGDGCWREGGTS